MRAELQIEYDPEYLASLIEAQPKPARAQPVRTSNFVCLQHQIQPTNYFCALCDSLREAEGKTEYARRIYINRNLPNFGYYE